MTEYKGIAPEHICALFEGCCGTVEMVNSRGLYLELSGLRVLLCGSQWGVVPNGAALHNWQSLCALFQPGEPVTVERGLINSKFRLLLQPVDRDTQICVPESMQAASMLLRSRKTHTGLSPLVYALFGEAVPWDNPYCTVAQPLLQALIRALVETDIAAIEQNAASLLGLGSGLTPSGDDVLSGLMYGLRHSPMRQHPATVAFKNTIEKLAREKTNRVSADYLMALAMDAPFEKMAKAWSDPDRYAEDLLSVGSNSGSEMLLGLLLADKVNKEVHYV